VRNSAYNSRPQPQHGASSSSSSGGVQPDLDRSRLVGHKSLHMELWGILLEFIDSMYLARAILGGGEDVGNQSYVSEMLKQHVFSTCPQTVKQNAHNTCFNTFRQYPKIHLALGIRLTTQGHNLRMAAPALTAVASCNRS
jgi:hypothetical protein